MPNDKEKVIRQLRKELATLGKESIELEKQLALLLSLHRKVEAEVIAMRDAFPQWISVDDELPDEGKEVLCFMPVNKQIPYVAIGNGEPVPERFRHIVDKVKDKKNTER